MDSAYHMGFGGGQGREERGPRPGGAGGGTAFANGFEGQRAGRAESRPVGAGSAWRGFGDGFPRDVSGNAGRGRMAPAEERFAREDFRRGPGAFGEDRERQPRGPGGETDFEERFRASSKPGQGFDQEWFRDDEGRERFENRLGLEGRELRPEGPTPWANPWESPMERLVEQAGEWDGEDAPAMPLERALPMMVYMLMSAQEGPEGEGAGAEDVRELGLTFASMLLGEGELGRAGYQRDGRLDLLSFERMYPEYGDILQIIADMLEEDPRRRPRPQMALEAMTRAAMERGIQVP